MEPFSKVVKMDIEGLIWPISFYRQGSRRVDIYRYGRGQSRCYLTIEGFDPREAPAESFKATFEVSEKGLFVHLAPLFGAERLVETVSLHEQIQETRRASGLMATRGRRSRPGVVSELAKADAAMMAAA